MIEIDIQEVINHIDDLIESTIGDSAIMDNDAKIQEFYNGMLFAYDEIKDFLKHRKDVEELRWEEYVWDARLNLKDMGITVRL